MNRSQIATRAFVHKTLERTGLTATELARRAGLAPSTLNRFLNSEDVKHTLSARTLMRIAAVAELSGESSGDGAATRRREEREIEQIVENLLGDTVEGDGDSTAGREFTRRREGLTRFPRPPVGPRDVPVLGVAVGGADGLFDMNGAAIDQAERPHTLQGVRDGYAVYMIGDSMEPKYEAGQILYVHPNRPPRVMDYVVVEFTDGRALVKRLLRRDDQRLVLRQYNPARDLEFDITTVKQVHKIVTADEPH